jgi:hypothetical protein
MGIVSKGPWNGASGSGNSEPPDNGDMDARVAKLEALAEKTGERLVTIERDIGIVKATMATREDLHKELHALSWRLVAFIFTVGGLLSAIVYYIARNVQ